MERLKGKKILVTGGAGFIGGHLVSELIKIGAKVSVIDIVVHPKSTFALNNLKNKVLLELVDIRDKKKVLDFFKRFKLDYIFHLAAEPIVEEVYRNPHRAFETNIMGTVNILEAVRKTNDIKGIIVASSDKAYGKTKKAYTEDSPLRADHPYDVSKASADIISQAYFLTYGLPVVITRFGNVYGEGDLHLNRIIPGICEAVIKDKTLKVRSDGTYVRDYLYVKDVVDGYLFLLDNFDKIKGEAYNFSSNDTLSVLQLIQKAENILHTKIPYKIVNTAINEIPYQHLNHAKIQSLGWKPRYTLNTSLSVVFDWYRGIFEKNQENDSRRLEYKRKILKDLNIC